MLDKKAPTGSPGSATLSSEPANVTSLIRGLHSLKTFSTSKSSQSLLNSVTVPGAPLANASSAATVVVVDSSPGHNLHGFDDVPGAIIVQSHAPHMFNDEENDHISELKLSMSSTVHLDSSVTLMTQQQQQQQLQQRPSQSNSSINSLHVPRPPSSPGAKSLNAGASASPSAATTNQNVMANMMSSPAPATNLNKPYKSLPKISSVFRTKSIKGARASSEQPAGANINSIGTTAGTVASSAVVISASSNNGGNSTMVNNVPISASNMNSISTLLPVLPQNKTGGLSAYEISPSASNALKRSYHLEDFHIVRRVGKGGFASVFLVRLKTSTGRYFALKAIKKADVLRLKQDKQVMNEKNILKNIRHSFIVELYQTFQDTFYLYMVMEYIDGGDLFSYLRKIQRFAEEDAKFYICEVLISLQYLHSENIVYRDLKPENILLDTTGHIKLADFGFAKVVRATTHSFCGTPDYIAAEVVNNHPYTKAVDWWSFGVLIFELVSGKTPFGDETSEKIYENITAGRIKWHQTIKGSCKDVIRRLLELDPTRRLGSVGDGNEIRGHPWFKNVNWKKVEARQASPPFLPACDAPEVIERERAATGKNEDFHGMLRSGGNKDGSWLTGADPFAETFKDF